MSKSLLSLIVGSRSFSNEATAMAINEIIGRDCTGFPAGAGVPGTIVDYEVTDPLTFGPPEGEGLRFRVQFSGRGVASGECKIDGAENNYTYARNGIIKGFVLVELGPDALVTAGLDQIVADSILNISLTALTINDKCPTQGPPEKFAGEA